MTSLVTCIANPTSLVPKLRWGEALPSKIQVSQSINRNSVLGPKPDTPDSLGLSFHIYYPCAPAQAADKFTSPRPSWVHATCTYFLHSRW